MNDLPLIDAHAVLGEEYHLHLTATELLGRMDEAGIATSLARPCGAHLAVYNTEGNDLVLQAHPRIYGLVTVNPWYGVKALDELNRCRDLGAKGLFLHPSIQGFLPVEELLGPLLEWAQQANWPVMFHTGTYIQSDVLALGELARLYPNLNFIAGFGGFTDMWFELPAVFREVGNLYLDASMIWGAAIEEIVRDCGPERILFGSAQPRNRYAVTLGTIERLNLPVAQSELILCGNARRLFNLA